MGLPGGLFWLFAVFLLINSGRFGFTVGGLFMGFFAIFLKILKFLKKN
jgi:hypothetical protein